ncbi:MAG TPA: class I SAM-dependent methyltransferase [Gemmatimonadaceae bacterium]|nr:class I SAM-dependent methyltransferase [Gemmatimonadaceae bacterium]
MFSYSLRFRSAVFAALAIGFISSIVGSQGASSTENARTPSGAPPPRTAESRDDWQRVPDIFSALGAVAGSRIADLGAGEGYLTTRLARHVGPAGRVFAVDISENVLERLSESLAKDSLRNVEVILSEVDDPRLPYRSLDGVVILNAYHEMTHRGAILNGIKRALKPDGVLVIVDNVPADRVVLRQRQTANHTLSIDFAEDDLQSAGFEIVKRAPDFIAAEDGRNRSQWMLVARRVRK